MSGANYYHELRGVVKAAKQVHEENKRRAERRAEMATAQVRSGWRLPLGDVRPGHQPPR